MLLLIIPRLSDRFQPARVPILQRVFGEGGHHHQSSRLSDHLFFLLLLLPILIPMPGRQGGSHPVSVPLPRVPSAGS